jgi:predicted phosphodiesterase
MNRWVFLSMMTLVLGCERPAKDRAERDREVGHASSAELDVDVAHGLAAVRTLEPERVVLWASAPGFELELDARSGRTLRLEVHNCLPDAVLVPLEPAATVRPVTLDPATRMAWDIELPPGVSRFRFAPRDADDPGTWTFALMSDVQEAIDGVQDIYQAVNAEPDVRFLLGAGDLTQQGTRGQLERFRDELLGLQVPYYTTLGNHELGVNPSLYQDYYGRGNFQFVFRGVYFTMLDSASATLDPLVYDWLDGWLARGRNSVHVVVMHVPPLDPAGVRNGAFGSRGEAAALLAKLAEGRVDLTLYGHIHSYYEFNNAGIPAYISGGGGAIPERFDDMGRHFMVIDIDAERGVRGTRVVRVFPEDFDD